MPRHPHIVPGQHHHRDAEDRSIEHLLPHAFEELRQCAGKGRDQARRHAAGQHAAGNPAVAMRHRTCDREHDADDETGLENLAKDDDQSR